MVRCIDEAVPPAQPSPEPESELEPEPEPVVELAQDLVTTGGVSEPMPEPELEPEPECAQLLEPELQQHQPRAQLESPAPAADHRAIGSPISSGTISSAVYSPMSAVVVGSPLPVLLERVQVRPIVLSKT